MIAILKQWKGKFEIDGKIYDNLDDVIDLKDGDSFQIKLLRERNNSIRKSKYEELED